MWKTPVELVGRTGIADPLHALPFGYSDKFHALLFHPVAKSPSELLSDVKHSLEHQADAYGSLVFGDLGTKPRHDHIEIEDPDSTLFGEPLQSDTHSITQEDMASPFARIEQLIPAESPLHRLKTLEETEQFVSGTVLIPLDETRTNPVFGVGNPKADLLVIGEAPGADEDKKGEPFVGRAGQLLTKILQAIGFEREDVYIANILKSRPPNNRDPLPGEIEAHIPVLYKQISLIQPKLILCVGKTAGTSLLGTKSSLAQMRSTFHDYHGLPVLVTYHPAALLRNPNWKRPTWDDVQLLRARYDELGGS